ncbi:uncharacterized protein C8orf58 homolog isoform X1 [Diceros bicornis minor]|uniref:uncharacterized protein C8orf58 homolog isoform X1 n=1 Tax=Diceros bicornis minor TaxID=77932 RepID=UPI0026EE0996|nr:uncharacterized protein C8orf58 homolog isoform X1 [Diceros bicornis minor]
MCPPGLERDLGGAVPVQSPPFTSGPDTPPWGMLPAARNAGGVEGSLPSLILTLFADGAGEDQAQGCVVARVTSTYRRIPDAAQGCSSDSWKGGGELRSLGRQIPLLNLASWDSGVEMVVGDSPLATSPGLSQDSLDFEPMGSPEPLALAAMTPPAHLGQLLASHKLEQVLEQSRQLPTSLASLSQHHRSPKPPSKPECEMLLFGAEDQEATKPGADPGSGPEEAEVVGSLGPGAWACCPGQGLCYLEHLCQVLEQMARLQQLHLQLQTQRPLGDPEEEEGLALASLPPPSRAPGSDAHRSWELLSQTQETGAKAASPLKAGVPSVKPPRLSEAPAEPAHVFPSSQGHKVKVLLNRIRWRSPRHPEPPAPPAGPAPRIESRDLPERPPYHPLRKTFTPSLVVKKQRAKNLSVC